MKGIIIILILIISLPITSFAQQQCDYKIDILLNSTEFTKDTFTWRMRATKIDGAPTNITGTAEIVDSENQIVKKYKPWNNEPISKQKTSSVYSPNLNEGEYRIISEIAVLCDDANKENNIDTKMIIINPPKR